ncbi:MAG: RecQ family ATP-dependent DNA helicase [Candidatus Gracilibacteria bacterium]|nr:RecQ family ATP-dependent DNA helicase [Candidatus Gracilibacteria bacterium]
MQNFEEILKTKFKLDNFREGQLEIIKSVIDKNDTLVFMPTGGGKSLVYQFAGSVLDGLVLIISPLISLMKDQVDKLNELGFRAEVINSTISTAQKNLLLDEISLNDSNQNGSVKFLYIAPERLNDELFLNTMQNVNIALIAIDEAHCISQWGHDFRPSYLKIRDFIENLRNIKTFPIVALTATATKKVRTDIIERLGLKDYKIWTSGFNRENLAFIVREISKEAEKLEKVLEIIKKTPPYGIIYCSSVKAVSKVYQYLLENGVKVGIYTGEMKPDLREQEQNNFMNSTYDVIVATNAFGMGIDKKNIRFVIHYNLPGSIENYYQEVGRAGRDGKNSYGVILASYQDTIIQEFFIENTYPPKTDILTLYSYLYKDFKIGEGTNHQILKTYNSVAIESGIGSDMKVGSIIKIFEKYSVLKRGFDVKAGETDFRGRGITLILPKIDLDKLPILWNHQNLLKEESYFKLEQVKKLLFKPGCRKRFILEYFGDEEDLKNMGENCGVCDYCIDKKKYDLNGEKEVIPKNVFLLVLEFIKRFDNKFGSQILASILVGEKDKKILEWNLDLDKDFAILQIYDKNLVLAIFDTLTQNGFLYKSAGQYPKIGITQSGIASIYNNSILFDEEKDLQSSLYFKVKNLKKSVKMKNSSSLQKIKIEKIDTYTQTLSLLQEKISLQEIAIKREMTIQTIEEHIVKLYSLNKLTLSEILKFSSLEKLKKIKETIKNNSLSLEKLKPIKDFCDENISYFDIKTAICMIEKGDL